MRLPSLAIVLVTACCTVAVQLTAQDSTVTPTRLCYRGRPAPHCQRFVLTELGYYARAAGSTESYSQTYTGSDGQSTTTSYTENDMSSQLTWEVGMMTNRGPRAALGATLLLGFGDSGGDVGLKGRYRRWLGRDGAALDVGGGVIRGTTNGRSGTRTGTGLTGDVALNAADYGAIVVRMDMLRAEGRNTSAIYGGVRLGSKPALVGTGALAVGFVLLLMAFASGDY